MTMNALSPSSLLQLWEQGLRRQPIDRALLLFGLAAPDTDPTRLADVALGRRNAALMTLYRAFFGDRLIAWADCTGCGERMEIAVDCPVSS